MAQPITTPTQTLQITGLPESLVHRLDARAKARGTDLSRQVRELLEKGLDAEEARPTERSFDQSLAGIRQGFAESGMDEDDSLELLTTTLKTVRAERREKATHE